MALTKTIILDKLLIDINDQNIVQSLAIVSGNKIIMDDTDEVVNRKFTRQVTIGPALLTGLQNYINNILALV
jgi:hypothetical protein